MFQGSVKLKSKVSNHIFSEREKYQDLVWYARSPRRGSTYWDDTPKEIRKGAFKNQKRVEKTYPEEVAQLLGQNTDFHHGFNSGMLAATRLFLMAAHPEKIGEEDGEDIYFGGLEEAVEWFPWLDT